MILAFKPSDRFGVVDEQGNVLTPNTVLLVLARHLIKNKGKKGAMCIWKPTLPKS
ncbi:MAG: hypothetical protein AAF349_23085 [Cyanobacteria bacterium P01_A01_bin.68]